MKIKTKKCKQCKEPFVVNPIYPLQWICTPICAIAYQKAGKEKAFTKQCRTEKKAFYEKNKKLSEYRHEARVEFQRWIRKRDFGLPCISCGCLTAKQWDGGHYLKAELFSGLIFTETNCHAQCSVCNDFRSGNELEYRDGLIVRYGLNYVVELEAIKNVSRNYKYTKQELIDIKELYKQKLKE